MKTTTFKESKEAGIGIRPAYPPGTRVFERVGASGSVPCRPSSICREPAVTARLEDLKPEGLVQWLVGREAVRIVSAEMLGAAACKVVYRGQDDLGGPFDQGAADPGPGAESASMTPSRLSITAAGQRFRVHLEQAEAGWLAYPVKTNGRVTRLRKPWRICIPPFASIATPSAPTACPRSTQSHDHRSDCSES